MGFLTFYRKRKKKDRELRILLLGLDNAGKSSTLCRIFEESPENIAPTFGFLIRSWVSENHLIHFWDIGGQCSLRPFWQNYFEKTDGIIWVVDGSDIDRFEEHVREFRNILQDVRIQGVSVLVLVNKRDLYTDAEEKIHRDAISKISSEIKVLASSAFRGSGITAG
eukprot:CAMPEP_0201524196 /NCGR_PEP_ID=MMETSP0161_2-20130828/21171_1 /ASSEMBLY_ACC=CAM_ASM_000251 /TAXON_ID=180227 /ORGANISM="Neoparamoeba aestuarina, Strain SoJaBio B1-5/56/2" /LENGTH=165 /DNA_ID=CAMNT_0047923489 /DNA_START=21 /DNA_END=515 /DNA_ORIENTATION=+